MSIFMGVLSIIGVLAFILVPMFIILDKADNGWYGLGWAAVSTLICAGVAGYIEDHQPPQEVYQLATADWECTGTYQVRQFTGKVYVTRTYCSEYSRKGK